MKKILITIFNYNNNDNAITLLDLFSTNFKTVVLDSGSDVKNDRFISFENIYYNGLLNEAMKLLYELDYEYLMFITSDVIIDQNEYIVLANSLLTDDFLENVGVYSPSATSESKSHNHCMNKNSNSCRNVLFVEGYFTLVKKEILDHIYPINLEVNRLGWCIDLLIGYHCNKLKCYVDDKITIFHPHGTGYDSGKANSEMYAYFNYLNNPDFKTYALFALGNGSCQYP